MRCFYDDEQPSKLVWLQSGGLKDVTYVKYENDVKLEGIPKNPEGSFCNEHWPCFLGYYLVTDTVEIVSPGGHPSKFVEIPTA